MMYDFLAPLGLLLAIMALVGSVGWLSTAIDESSWSTYHDHGKYCITLTRSDNHVFSPDKTYIDNWCK